jgi:hypothetical protein
MSLTDYLKTSYASDQNPVVNGNMSVHQRVNAITVPNLGASTVYTLDQWVGYNNGNGHVTTISQQSIPLNETAFLPETTPTNYLRWAQTTAGTGATVPQVYHLIENPLLWAGLRVTLSFWARNSVNGATLGVNLRQNVTGGATTATKTFNLTTSWKKYSYTATLGNSVTALGGQPCLVIAFFPQPNLVQNFDLTLVQLERGQEATPFKYETFETTLRRCQRYYQKSFNLGVAPAQNAGASGCHEFAVVVAGATIQSGGKVYLGVQMRTTPTITFYNPLAANAFVVNLANSAQSATTTGSDRPGDRSFNVTFTGNAAFAVGTFAGVHWTASAEI